MKIHFNFYTLITGILICLLICEIIMWRIKIKALLGKIKRRIWNKHILLYWYKLWVRKDEFHISLSRDPAAMEEMNKKELEEYNDDLLQRRKIAHRKS